MPVVTPPPPPRASWVRRLAPWAAFALVAVVVVVATSMWSNTFGDGDGSGAPVPPSLAGDPPDPLRPVQVPTAEIDRPAVEAGPTASTARTPRTARTPARPTVASPDPALPPSAEVAPPSGGDELPTGPAIAESPTAPDDEPTTGTTRDDEPDFVFGRPDRTRTSSAPTVGGPTAPHR